MTASNPFILDEEDVTFLTDILSRRSLAVREAMLDGYSGNRACLVNDLKSLSSQNLALDRMNLFIHKALSDHHESMAVALQSWIQSKGEKP